MSHPPPPSMSRCLIRHFLLKSKNGSAVPNNQRRQNCRRWLSSSGSAITSSSSLSTTATTSSSSYTDVLIVGGGVVGCSLARLLNERLPTLSVGLLEARGGPPPPPPATATADAAATTIPHPRSYALSPRSLQILGNQTLESIPLGYYDSMQVWECRNPATLIFTNKDLCDDDHHHSKLDDVHLGAVAEDFPLVQSLWYQIQNMDSSGATTATTTCYTNTTIEKLILPPGSTSNFNIGNNNERNVKVQTNTGETISTRLLVAADGANSQIRKLLGIPMIGWEYGRQALTFTVELKGGRGHGKRAYQRFLPDGPVALLPTHSDNHAVVVWSTTPETVKKWKDQQPDDLLIQELQSIFQEGPQVLPPLLEQQQRTAFPPLFQNILYGCERIIDTVQYGTTMMGGQDHPFYTPPEIGKISSPKFSFDLSCRHAQEYVKPAGLALVGDAAHNTHPMAGQGLNLGLADVEVLVDCMESRMKVGMDFADTICLNSYEDNRRKQVSATLAGIHTLHELFGSQATPIKHAKSFGMNMIQNVPPLRRTLVQAATHGVVL